MKTVPWDRIITSAPLNKTAAVVRDGIGETWSPEAGKSRETWFAPPAMKRPMKNSQNYAGTEFGKLTVIGLSAERSGRWVVRCQCGAYEERRRKAMLSPLAHEDACRECAYRAYTVKRAEAEKRGVWPDGKPFNLEPPRWARGTA